MRTRGVAVVLTAVLVVLLGGCGNAPGGAPDSTASAPGSPASTPSPPGPSPSPPVVVPPSLRPPSPPPPSDRPGLTTLTGEAFAGVEAGCVLLGTSSGDYLLIGAAASQVRMGSTVTVRGLLRANLATTCQQGVPFEVVEVVD